MSGHSKWSKIKRQKGATDAKRGNLFTKLSKNITLAAKTGGGDPEMNFNLRLAVDKAKIGNMPKDNITKAIKRGTGELEGGTLEEITYEGYGPGGTAILIKTVTDNKNRTVSAIKHILNKYQGSLGGPNSVAWMFTQRGVIRLNEINDKPTSAKASVGREKMELKAIDAGAEDIISENDDIIIYTAPTELQKIKENLEQGGTEVEYAELEMIAKDQVEITPEQKNTLEKLLEALAENEDVDDYYTNVVI